MEMRTQSSKTAKIDGMKGEVLCLVALAAGVSHVKWAPAWKETLEHAGLFGRKEAPALPAFKQGGAYRRMLASAGAAPLRVSCFTKHGLKATCLSWAAK
eukprot:4252631-Amphidinium_carterae.2